MFVIRYKVRAWSGSDANYFTDMFQIGKVKDDGSRLCKYQDF